MYNFSMLIKQSNSWVQIATWVRPFYDTATLDESLDGGNVDLAVAHAFASEIAPFQRVKIVVTQNGAVVDTIYCNTASTAKTQRTFGA